VTTTDRIKHIIEEKSLLQIFAKIVGIFIYLPLTIRIRFAHMVFWDTTYHIEHIHEKKSLLQIFAKIGHNPTVLIS